MNRPIILPPRRRLARNIRIGYEILVGDTWHLVTDDLWITEPVDIITFTLADGTTVVYPPTADVMSRRPEGRV